MIVILLFNLLFPSMSSFRGVRRTAVQMPMLRESRGWFFFGFRRARYRKSRACWLNSPATCPYIVIVHCKTRSTTWTIYGHLKSLNLARDSKTF